MIYELRSSATQEKNTKIGCKLTPDVSGFIKKKIKRIHQINIDFLNNPFNYS